MKNILPHLLAFLCLTLLLVSCEKDFLNTPSDIDTNKIGAVQNMTLAGPASGAGVTQLGDVLTNPYSFEVIKEACILLGLQSPSAPTHYYLRVNPSDGAHIE
ncbi:MAG: hypothetical protein AB8H12_17415 [Lewinella sp.]